MQPKEIVNWRWEEGTLSKMTWSLYISFLKYNGWVGSYHEMEHFNMLMIQPRPMNDMGEIDIPVPKEIKKI